MHERLPCSLSRLSSSKAIAIVRIPKCLPRIAPVLVQDQDEHAPWRSSLRRSFLPICGTTGSASLKSAQFEHRHAKGDIEPDRAFEGQRLQGDGACRTADQDISASTHANADIARGPDIFASK